MGIPGLNSWFKRTFSEAYVDLGTVKVDHLYIDMNSILHLVLRRAKTMHMFYVLLYRKIDFILTCCRPQKSVMFAMDGPAPLAKLLTQRIRRKRMMLTASDEKGKTVSPLALTPGTPFMQEVHEALAYFICQRLIGSRWKHLRMELSGSTVQGEGETKILARLQRPMRHVLPTDSHALIGNDSDLLMMSLFVEQPKVYVLGQILNSEHDLPKSPDRLKVFSVEKLRQPLLSMIPSLKKMPDALKTLQQGLRRDLAIACILSRGNDYLPSVGGLSVESADDAYRFKRDSGLWSSYLQLRNGETFQRRSLARDKNGMLIFDYEFLYELFKHAGIQPLVRKIPESKKGPDAAQYLDGLRWVLDMYSRGVCPDYRFVYEGMGPSSQELCNVILERQQHSGARLVHHHAERMPLRPSECALALLPYQAQRYLPHSLRHLMEKESPIGDLFEDCEECKKLSQENGDLQRELQNRTIEGMKLKEKMEAYTGDKQKFKKLEQQSSAYDQQTEAVRQKIRENCAAREEHTNSSHPYKPFPIDRIEEAVRKLSVTNFKKSDVELFNFGHDYVFLKGTTSSTAKTSFRLSQIHKNAPQPPSERFKRFKVPLPILRGQYVGDRMTRMGMTQMSHRFLSTLKRIRL